MTNNQPEIVFEEVDGVYRAVEDETTTSDPTERPGSDAVAGTSASPPLEKPTRTSTHPSSASDDDVSRARVAPRSATGAAAGSAGDSPRGELVVVDPGGSLRIVAASGVDRPVSVVPEERMAAGSDWGSIIHRIRENEEGGGVGSDTVVVAPGGGLALIGKGEAEARNLSRVPEVRMAGSLLDEAYEVSRLDPDNVEEWADVPGPSGSIAWKFALKAPWQTGHFTFLTFKNPSRRNKWDLIPIFPNLDDSFGHSVHLIPQKFGSETVTIICGPGGEPAESLTAVRGVAAKWTAYTSARLAGRDPGFSL
ncbi:hypothetical protein SAMN06295885_0757 [Rathayibacter oskolensis]|uniref:Uncharacterized protein n=1 Tax=Rathayibacter oskolensis TaxID=1891671 RepID=A0A1X7N5C2_9MICO|nr:hypothetical protein [Rathayibacter oskolensis]SMH32606.1 hypothetical protein SAMN06295885_0757 [Rathayibacter oskolensis]